MKITALLLSACLALGPVEPLLAAEAFEPARRTEAVPSVPALTVEVAPPALTGAQALPGAPVIQGPAAPPPALPASLISAPLEPAAEPGALSPPQAAQAPAQETLQRVGEAVGRYSEVLSKGQGPSDLHAAGGAIEDALTGATDPTPAETPQAQPPDDVAGAAALNEAQTAALREAVRYVQESGIDLRLPGQSPDGRTLLAAREASSRGDAAVHDRLVRALVREHLTRGLPEAIRFSPEEADALGYAPDSTMSAAQAVSDFKKKMFSRLDELRPFKAQEGRVDAVAFSPDGKLALSGGEDRRLRLWDAAGGRLLHAFEAQPGRILSVAFAPDGRSALSTGNDGEIEVWDVAARKPAGALRGHDSGVHSLTLSRDGKRALSAGFDGRLILWNLKNRKEIRAMYRSGDGGLTAAAISPDGDWALSGDDHGWLTLWDLGSGSARDRFKAVDWAVTSIAFSPDGGSFAVGGRDWTVKLFSLTNLKETRVLKGHKGSVASLAFSPDGRRLASAGEDKTVRLWDVEGAREVWWFSRHENTVESVAFSPDGKTLLSGGHDGALRFWNAATGEEVDNLEAAREAAARALAENLPLADAGAMKSLARAVLASDSSSFREIFWEPLKRYVLGPAEEDGSLRAVPGSATWFPGEEQKLKARMPTLWSILADPGRLKRLLLVLSFLRLAYPYDRGPFFTPPAIAYSRWTGIEFGLNELHIVPVGESFRRHIVYVEDGQGLSAVELKIPGEDEGRKWIFPQHFTVAKQLWDQSPDDPGVVKPIRFSQYEGSVKMYGQEMEYTREEPLGIMLFGYEEGKRLRNADLMIKDLARAKGVRERAIRVRALADAAAAAIRLHRLGWRGATKEATDMHDENVRLLASGRAVLAGDFGIFRRESLTMSERKQETLALLGQPGLQNLLDIYPLVVEALTKGAGGWFRRALIKREIRRELGLSLVDLMTPRSL